MLLAVVLTFCIGVTARILLFPMNWEGKKFAFFRYLLPSNSTLATETYIHFWLSTLPILYIMQYVIMFLCECLSANLPLQCYNGISKCNKKFAVSFSQ